MAMADTVDPGNAFAERLGQWIHFADAITLSAVLGEGVTAAASAQPGTRAAALATATEEFRRTQTSLQQAIVQSCAPAGTARVSLPAPPLDLPADPAAAYAPYRRFYEAHQRDMEMRLQPLRRNLRDALAHASPRLGKLAELDATLEKVLQERERQFLARVPALLRKRFEQLFREHQQALADAGAADQPADWMRAGGWLARFRNDMQTLLLAELELRLQPATGLMEAFKQETQ